jgi:hypothetical protein
MRAIPIGPAATGPCATLRGSRSPGRPRPGFGRQLRSDAAKENEEITPPQGSMEAYRAFSRSNLKVYIIDIWANCLNRQSVKALFQENWACFGTIASSASLSDWPF